MQERNSEELQRLRKSIDWVNGRFSGLLTYTITIMLLLAAGIVLRAAPRVLWMQNSDTERNYVPQLLVGLLLLVVLLSCHVLDQRNRLKKVQNRLITELVRCETAERLAIIDPLTELYNRRYVTEAISKEIARASRQNSSLSFLMIDVDNFKRANDMFGHLVGDHILREVGLLLRRTFRTSDIISRYGGDEFLVLLVDSNEENASCVRRRLQNAVDTWNEGDFIKGYRMGLSSGTATYKDGEDPNQIVAAADKAMYEDKRNDHPKPNSNGSDAMVAADAISCSTLPS
jgi:diguanylate cyclase (GGDEF)-like protein